MISQRKIFAHVFFRLEIPSILNIPRFQCWYIHYSVKPLPKLLLKIYDTPQKSSYHLAWQPQTEGRYLLRICLAASLGTLAISLFAFLYTGPELPYRILGYDLQELLDAASLSSAVSCLEPRIQLPCWL